MRLAMASIGIAAILSLSGVVTAEACIGEAPPSWERLRVEGGPALIIGRVATVARTPEPKRTDYFEVWEDTAVIRRVEFVQGDAKAEYTVTAVGDYSRLREGPMFCADRMALKPGELIVGYERADGSLRVVESHQIPEDIRPRLEAYR